MGCNEWFVCKGGNCKPHEGHLFTYDPSTKQSAREMSRPEMEAMSDCLQLCARSNFLFLLFSLFSTLLVINIVTAYQKISKKRASGTTI